MSVINRHKYSATTIFVMCSAFVAVAIFTKTNVNVAIFICLNKCYAKAIIYLSACCSLATLLNLLSATFPTPA